jgi:hypothetical protein
MSNSPEVWLSGPVRGVPPQLQPVAHALIQARDDVAADAAGLSTVQLWRRPGRAASAGFHLMHLAGALDRLFTYARGERLDDAQKAAARAEADDHPSLEAAALIALVHEGVERALAQLRSTPESSLLDERKIGRAGLPSTVMGVLFHAAEHSIRHAGQLRTTVLIGASPDGGH